jgi:hypothetical protein
VKKHEDYKMPRNLTVNKSLYLICFIKPLLLIGMENALALVDLPPVDETSQVVNTLAIVNFHCKFMQCVFADEKTLKMKQKTGFDKKETI